MNPDILVGCAGWSLSSALQSDFPAEGSHLERYAAVLPVAEINSSFYRPHRPATYARWRDSVPDHFRFSVKLPRAVTHDKRLIGIDGELERFLSEAGELGHKLGCLLVQLPPSLQFDAAVAQAFFENVCARTGVPVACEPRHATWFTREAGEMLVALQIARVMADPPVVAQPVLLPTTLVYARLHGSPVIYRSAYEEAYLQRLATHCNALAAEGRKVWCVFDNTANGAAIPNALFFNRACRSSQRE